GLRTEGFVKAGDRIDESPVHGLTLIGVDRSEHDTKDHTRNDGTLDGFGNPPDVDHDREYDSEYRHRHQKPQPPRLQYESNVHEGQYARRIRPTGEIDAGRRPRCCGNESAAATADF